MTETKAHTQDGQSGVGYDDTCIIFGRARVDAHVSGFDVDDEEDVIVAHDMHASLVGSRKIVTAIFLPRYLRSRRALSVAFQTGRVAHFDANVRRRFGERRENCGDNQQLNQMIQHKWDGQDKMNYHER